MTDYGDQDVGKRGPKPAGDHALTGAERMARYRAKIAEPSINTNGRKPSRQKQWKDAVSVLVKLQLEYQAQFDALPESRLDSNLAGHLEEVCGIDLSELIDANPPR